MQGALFETLIKYDLLDSLLEYYVTNVKYSSEIKIYLDLKTILKKAYRTNINNILKDQKVIIEDITSHIINMIGFYRNYFYKQGKYSTFYILYSEKECETLKSLYPEYKNNYYEKYLNNEDEFQNLNNIIKSTVKQVKILSKYIPHVYYIDTSDFDEFIYFNYLVRHSGNSFKILFSDDPIMFQALDKDTVALDVKGENSNLITNENVIQYLCENNSVTLTSNSLNIILSITGNSEYYNIKGIQSYKYKKAYKLLEPFFKNVILVNKTYMNIPEVIFTNELLKENRELIEKNFKVMFPIEIQMINESKIEEKLIITKPKVSWKEFEKLNQRIFLLFPLNLNMILKGESIDA